MSIVLEDICLQLLYCWLVKLYSIRLDGGTSTRQLYVHYKNTSVCASLCLLNETNKMMYLVAMYVVKSSNTCVEIYIVTGSEGEKTLHCE